MASYCMQLEGGLWESDGAFLRALPIYIHMASQKTCFCYTMCHPRVCCMRILKRSFVGLFGFMIAVCHKCRKR